MERQKCVCFSEKGSAVCLQGEQDNKESNAGPTVITLMYMHHWTGASLAEELETIVYIVYIHISNGGNDSS